MSIKSKINCIPYIVYLCCISIPVTLDFLTKNWAFNLIAQHFPEGFFGFRSIPITSFFSISEVANTGISFGMFGDITYIKWIIVSFTILIAIILILQSIFAENQTIRCMFLIMFSGAMGNLYDRITLGYVRDFIDFHLFGTHFPAFNIADVSITISAITILFWDSIWQMFNKLKSAKQ